MSNEPNVGEILIGIFIILFGLCIALVGGGCTILLVATLGEGSGDGGLAALLLVSLAVLAFGLFLAWVGIKLMIGRYRK